MSEAAQGPSGALVEARRRVEVEAERFPGSPSFKKALDALIEVAARRAAPAAEPGAAVPAAPGMTRERASVTLAALADEHLYVEKGWVGGYKAFCEAVLTQWPQMFAASPAGAPGRAAPTEPRSARKRLIEIAARACDAAIIDPDDPLATDAVRRCPAIVDAILEAIRRSAGTQLDLKFCSLCGEPYNDNAPEMHTCPGRP